MKGGVKMLLLLLLLLLVIVLVTNTHRAVRSLTGTDASRITFLHTLRKVSSMSITDACHIVSRNTPLCLPMASACFNSCECECECGASANECTRPSAGC